MNPVFKINGDRTVDILDADNYFEHIGSVTLKGDRSPFSERTTWRWSVKTEAPGGSSGGGYLFIEPH